MRALCRDIVSVCLLLLLLSVCVCVCVCVCVVFVPVLCMYVVCTVCVFLGAFLSSLSLSLFQSVHFFFLLYTHPKRRE